jgi:zinc-finger of transposase IS204/IS1001/IS1096/IS1165
MYPVGAWEVHDTFAHVLPKSAPLHLDARPLDGARARSTLPIASTQTAPHCPGCHVPARHVHGRSTRTLADLPWSGDAITWPLRVRNLVCSSTKCPRRRFTERRPGLVAPWARRP